jgi:hypothetical protein
MPESLISFLREEGEKIELNKCIALMSKFFIEGGDGLEDFPNFAKELKKYTTINPKRSELYILERWWNEYPVQQKLLFIGPMFSISKGMVTIPKPKKVAPKV